MAGHDSEFAESRYQGGVVSGNVWRGRRMRAAPDVSALGDWNLGYQIGLTAPSGLRGAGSRMRSTAGPACHPRCSPGSRPT